MKKSNYLIILIFVMLSQLSFGQSISIYDIDTTNFPTIKAKFYAFDKDGNQVRPSASELSISEDGTPRNIISVNCPLPRRVKLSVGIMVDTYGYINLARLGTESFINLLDMPKEDEVAITYMNGRASIWQDFTKNRNTALEKAKTIPNAPGVDINTMFYSEFTGGVPLIIDRKTDKKVLILVSDLHCPNLNIDEAKLITDAKAYNISIYSVLLGTNDYSGLFKRIASGSGGTVFENVRNETEIANVFEEIPYINNNDPCEISWESEGKCLTENISVELSWNSLKSKYSYKQISKSIGRLEVSPSFISFDKIPNPEIKDTTITLTAINTDFTINGIIVKFGNSVFSIVNTNFPIVIPKNTTKMINIRCSPLDSSLNYASFEIQTNLCTFYFSAISGFPGNKIKTPTLKLTHPNGGEVFIAGSDTVITWEGISPNDTCQIQFSSNNGKSWRTLTNEATNLSYKWNNVSSLASENCLIRISQFNYLIKDSVGQILKTLKGHKDRVFSIAYSPDGKTIISGTSSNDRSIKIWDVNTGNELNKIESNYGYVNKVIFHSDGISFASTGYGVTDNITLWDLNKGELIRYFNGQQNSDVKTIAFSPNGSLIASGGYKTIKIWDVYTGQELKSITQHNDLVRTVAFSPDNKLIASGSFDLTIKLWDVGTGSLFQNINIPNWVYTLAFNPDGKTIVAGFTDNLIKIWDIYTGNQLLTLEGHTKTVYCVTYNTDGSMLASSSFDGTIKLWDAFTGKLIRTFDFNPNQFETNFVFDIAFNPDGKTLAAGYEDNTIKICSVSKDILQSDQSDAVFSIIAPEPQFQQLNIDMGQVVVGSSKDTMVTAVLCNVGEAPLHVLGVDVTNGNTNEFMVPRGAGDFFLPPNECRDMMFAFMPSQVGVRNAKITVKSTIGDYIDTINITGVGILPTVQIVNKFIDFGYIDIFSAKDTLQAVTIKNVSNVDIDIKNSYHSGPNDKDFTTLSGGGAFKLLAGETAKLDMRFLPTSIGRTSGTFMFEYDGVGSPAVVQLFGAGVGGVASLKLDSIETKTSTIVEYPVKLTLDSKVLKSGANAVNFDVTYNNTLLYPTENYSITNENGFATIKFTNVPLTKDPIQILQTLRFKTGLGNAIETPLTISNFELVGTTEEVDVTLFDGNFKLTDVCYDGGVRLINPNSQISMSKISPNPVESKITIDLNLIEIGKTEIAIYNLMGEKVKTIFDKDITETGSISVSSEISDLSNGQYVVVFTTPTYTERSNILILK